jgi:hypothetical protein
MDRLSASLRLCVMLRDTTGRPDPFASYPRPSAQSVVNAVFSFLNHRDTGLTGKAGAGSCFRVLGVFSGRIPPRVPIQDKLKLELRTQNKGGTDNLVSTALCVEPCSLAYFSVLRTSPATRVGMPRARHVATSSCRMSP